MKKKIVIGVGIVVVIALFVLFKSTNSGNAHNVRIGVISILSGEFANVGESFLNGVKIAREEWNAENPNKQIDILVEDDGFDSKKGLSAYKKLTDVDNVDALINASTITIDSIAKDLNNKKIPTAQGFIQTTPADDNIFQLWPSADTAELKLGEYVREKKYKNIVVFVDKVSSVFTVFADSFKKGYELPVTEIKIGSDTTEIRSAALKIKEINPDAIAFIVAGETGSLLIREIEQVYGSSNKPRYIFDANIQAAIDTSYKKILGDTNRLNGSLLYTVPVNYTNKFTLKYKEKYKVEPTVGSETGYNAFMLIASSYNSDPSIWINNMKKADFIGADGEVKLDTTGTRIPMLKIGTIENGKLPQ